MKPCPYQYNLCFIKIILHSRHGVALFRVFKLLHVHLQLAVETTHLYYDYKQMGCQQYGGTNFLSIDLFVQKGGTSSI